MNEVLSALVVLDGQRQLVRPGVVHAVFVGHFFVNVEGQEGLLTNPQVNLSELGGGGSCCCRHSSIQCGLYRGSKRSQKRCWSRVVAEFNKKMFDLMCHMMG